MNKDRSFEQAIQQLEEIVSKLENPETSLEDAMNLFGEGVKLSSECAKKLEDAKQAVHMLIDAQDGKAEKEFLADEE